MYGIRTVLGPVIATDYMSEKNSQWKGQSIPAWRHAWTLMCPVLWHPVRNLSTLLVALSMCFALALSPPPFQLHCLPCPAALSSLSSCIVFPVQLHCLPCPAAMSTLSWYILHSAHNCIVRTSSPGAVYTCSLQCSPCPAALSILR
jgi:hypothetical protein